ncbi:MAG TPA: hypothetical protein VJN18_18280 [Polyangiaceae bacterium]|nr:hypothetical protein [Polyangiaceae bacterium]
MQSPRPLLAALALVALGSLARPAAAQLAIGVPDWNTDRGNRKTNRINREDCLANAEITFDTDFQSTVSGSFQLWAGAGCEDATKRTEGTGCVKVGEGSNPGEEVTVRVQNLVKKTGDTAEGTDATCDIDHGDGIQARTLFFLVIDSSDMVAVQGQPSWQYEFDTVGPAAPTMVTASSGESSVNLEFKGPGGTNLDDYRFYCAPADGDCSAAALTPGMPPDETTFCGDVEATGSDSGSTDSKLQNNVLYAVGIATMDNVGNVGVLSELACATPQEVTGFFEAYRAAGGKAGGGFCGYAPARGGALPLSAALLLGVLALGRRRR